MAEAGQHDLSMCTWPATDPDRASCHGNGTFPSNHKDTDMLLFVGTMYIHSPPLPPSINCAPLRATTSSREVECRGGRAMDGLHSPSGEQSYVHQVGRVAGPALRVLKIAAS